MRKVLAVRAALFAAMWCCGFAGHAVADLVPRIWVATNPNHPGAAVQVRGRGFGPKETIDIYFDKTDEVQVVAWKNGGFGQVPLTVPANALPGRHRITAISRASGDMARGSFSSFGPIGRCSDSRRTARAAIRMRM